MDHELLRTVSHFHDDGSESVITVSKLTFRDGSVALSLGTKHRDDRILITSAAQAKQLAAIITMIADTEEMK